MKNISQDKFGCPYCGAIHKGSLKYCPNCHERQYYDEGIQTINNEPDNPEENVDKTIKGCGCFIVGIILFVLWNSFILQ